MNIHFQITPFNELTVAELYDILQLRTAVFVVEQNCVYQDMDGKDQISLHLLVKSTGSTLLAYARLLPPHVSYTEPSIGRVVSNPAFRKAGFGKILMQKAIESVSARWPHQGIRISAQLYLLQFYQNLGFSPVGESYLEDNIPHIEMLYIN